MHACTQVVYLLCGLLRVSKIIRFLSHSVMTGFTSGAAFFFGFSQLKACFGLQASTHGLAGAGLGWAGLC